MAEKSIEDGKSNAEKDIARIVMLGVVGLAAVLILWPSVKEFITPIWKNMDDVKSLKRDVEEIKKDMNDVLKFFPRQPMR